MYKLKRFFIFFSFICLISLTNIFVYSQPANQEQWHYHGCISCGEINDVKWSPDGSMLAYSNKYGLFIYDSVSLELIAEITDEPTKNIGWSQSGTFLTAFHSAGTTSVITIWDVANGQRLIDFPVTTQWASFSWHPDKDLLTFSNGFDLQSWDAESKQIIQSISFNIERPLDDRMRRQGLVWQIAWDPDGAYLAVSTADHEILLWNAQNELVEKRFDALLRVFDQIEWDMSGRYLLLSGSVQTSLLDTTTGEITEILFEQQPTFATWSPDGTEVATNYLTLTSFDILIWSSFVWRTPHYLLREDPGLSHSAEITVIAWSPDGKRIASGSLDGSIRIWELKNYP